MNEREILEQLRKAAEEVEIPEALRPEQIERQLREQQKETERKNKEKQVVKKKYQKTVPWRRIGSMAAVLALVICSGIYVKVTGNHSSLQEDKPDTVAIADHTQTAEGTAGVTEAESLGDMYHLASDYNEVYETALRSYRQNQGGIAYTEGLEKETASAESSGFYSKEYANESAASDAAGESSGMNQDYSTTNLQTEGVDESDIAKTDGSYIYTVEDNQVVITDIRDGRLEKIAQFQPEGIQPADKIEELYVDGDRLLLVAESYETTLEQAEDATEDVYYAVDYYEMKDHCSTQILVYNITDRSRPEYKGQLKQDGYYETSRKIGDVIYLFTRYQMNVEPLEYAAKEYSGLIPEVNGEQISSDEIYLPKEGTSGMLVTSMDMNEPDEVSDSKLVVTGYAQTYVSKDALYLYQEDYGENVVTSIAKFALEDGMICGVDATAVPGYIRDTFAINACDGYLRILTTDDNRGETVNALYILDKDMKLTGQLTGIAPGEEIYSARFMGNVGYFVTYRNTDPLFAVDISEPESPKILGELKVSGFSEYLHFWDDTHLLGIGYESDEKTGTIGNIKLSMFDITNPSEMTEEAKLVLKDVDYSEALYDYKSVVISKDKNLIGLLCETYGGMGNKQTYQIYTYEDGNFQKVAEIPIRNFDTVRGMYSGNTFYLWNYNTITAYDMTDDFKMLQERK